MFQRAGKRWEGAGIAPGVLAPLPQWESPGKENFSSTTGLGTTGPHWMGLILSGKFESSQSPGECLEQLILPDFISQKCNQNHPQAKSDPNFLPGSLFHTNPNVPKSLSGLCISTGAHTGLEAAPNISEPQKCSKKKSCSFQKWPLLFCTVMICLWNIYNCHHPEPTQFS